VLHGLPISFFFNNKCLLKLFLLPPCFIFFLCFFSFAFFPPLHLSLFLYRSLCTLPCLSIRSSFISFGIWQLPLLTPYIYYAALKYIYLYKNLTFKTHSKYNINSIILLILVIVQ
jgi:hypothetical protein